MAAIQIKVSKIRSTLRTVVMLVSTHMFLRSGMSFMTLPNLTNFKMAVKMAAEQENASSTACMPHTALIVLSKLTFSRSGMSFMTLSNLTDFKMADKMITMLKYCNRVYVTVA